MSLCTNTENETKVVLDTNIIISAAISDKGNPASIILLLAMKSIKNYTSQELIEELMSIINGQEILERIDTTRKETILKQYTDYSIKITPARKIDIVKDPKDNKFIEVAAEAKADFLISGDPHLTDIKEYKGIRIVKPKEFLDIYNGQKNSHFR